MWQSALQMDSRSILISAGEASGDLHGASLARALSDRVPGIRLFGLGGPQMAAAGVQCLAHASDVAVVGLTEIGRHLGAILRALRRIRQAIERERPAALVLIDFPEFNFRLGRAASRLGIPVVYYVAPQVWAWRRYRAREMARWLTKLLAVFPFEVPFYERFGVPVQLIGHPILDSLPCNLTREQARRALEIGPDEALVGLLPGSRHAEVQRMLPVMLNAAKIISRQRPAVSFRLALAPSVEFEQVRHLLTESPHPCPVEKGATYQVMAAADLLLVASGTATLEGACFGTPMVILYRVSPVTYLVGRLLIHGVDHIGLPNLLAGQAVVPELIQANATPERTALEALALLERPAAWRAQHEALLAVKEALGSPGATTRAAEIILNIAGW